MTTKNRKSKGRQTTESIRQGPPRPSSLETAPRDEVIDMEEAIGLLKTTRPTFYRWLRAGKFRGMKTGRQWRFYRGDIEAFLRGEGPRIALSAPITPLLKTLAAAYKELGGGALTPAGKTDLEQVAYLTLGVALLMPASDIHIHGIVENEAVIRMRVDGVLHNVARFDSRLLSPMMEQWKVLTSADLSEKAVSLDGHGMSTVNGVPLDLRSSFVQTALGDSLTIRVLSRNVVYGFRLEKLQISPEAKSRLAEGLKASTGIIVVTGPSGCGITTTLYSALTHLASPEVKVMTAENPVEVLLENVVQIPVRPELGMAFPAVIMRIFRSDPDIVMVGETRDRQTLELCGKAAVAGHLILTSLHTPSAVGTLYHMGSLLEDPGLISLGSVLRLVLAQRLLRKVCTECSTAYDPPRGLLEEAKTRATAGGLKWETLPRKFRTTHGCSRCGKTGYSGRVAVGEALTITPAILQALRSGVESNNLEKLAIEQGMVTLAAQGIKLAATGVTTLDEVLRIFR